MQFSFDSEKQLQAFMAATLNAAGEPTQREVLTSNKRFIDILSDAYLIECKKVLERGSLLQAAGQLGLYKASFPDRQCVIAGLLPKSDSAIASARSAAADISAEFGYDVWFIEEIPLFQGAYESIQEQGDLTVPAAPTGKRPINLYREPKKESMNGMWAFAVLVAFVIAGVRFFGNDPSKGPEVAIASQSEPSLPKGVEMTVDAPTGEVPVWTGAGEHVGQVLNGSIVIQLKAADAQGFAIARKPASAESFFIKRQYLKRVSE